MPASKKINNEKSNRFVTHTALERSSDYITSWWLDAFIDQNSDSKNQFFLEAGQTLPLLIANPASMDVIEAMKMHRIRLAKDQGLRAWEPKAATYPREVQFGI